jgi:hypothetical protein
MAISNRDKPDNFETTLQPDPMLRTGRASSIWVWTVAGAIMIILIFTFIGLNSRNSNLLPNALSSTVSRLLPLSASQPAPLAPPAGRTTSLAPRADENTGAKQ